MPEVSEQVQTFPLHIITPFGTAYRRHVSAVEFQTGDGLVEILPRHEPLMTTVKIGMVLITTPVDEVEMKQEVYAVHGGFVQMDGEELTVFAIAAEAGDAIDMDRAKEAARRARERLDQVSRNASDVAVDVERAKLALLRAIARMNARETELELKTRT